MAYSTTVLYIGGAGGGTRVSVSLTVHNMTSSMGALLAGGAWSARQRCWPAQMKCRPALQHPTLFADGHGFGLRACHVCCALLVFSETAWLAHGSVSKTF